MKIMVSVLYAVLVFLLLIEQCSTFSIALHTRRCSSNRSSVWFQHVHQWKRPVNTEKRHYHERPYSMLPLYGSEENEIHMNEEEVQQLKKEEEDLQNELHYIQALVQRNKAQLGSFVDEKHQWESQSEEDRYFLTRKPLVKKRLAEIRLKLTSYVPKEL